MRLTLHQAVESILERDTPILMIDTCSLLDLIRAPVRGKVNVVEGGHLLAQICDRGLVTIVVTEEIEKEYKKNKPSVLADLVKFIKSTKSNVKQIQDTLAIIGPPPRPYDETLGCSNLEGDLERLADGLLNRSIVLTHESRLFIKGYARVTQAIPPSSHGKESTKDCVIIEHFLSLVASLKERCYLHKTVFVTSNEDDFGKAPVAEGVLARELGDLEIKYCNQLKWALHEANLLTV